MGRHMGNVQVRGLTKNFGEQAALRNVSLAFGRGEFVAIVGPSGCGKSTLLRLLAGLDQPTSGDILFDDVSVVNASPSERGVAMVFQSYALYPHLSVYENIAFPLRLLRRSTEQIDASVRQTAKLLAIEDLLNRKPRALSGGQRQRVAIGRAIVRQPKILLLDEPLSNLDAALRIHMRHEFARLHRELGTTTIYVTHDQIEAMTLAERIIVLNDGRIEQTGTPSELYHHPRNLFVAGFIGSPKMNFFPSTLASSNAGQIEILLKGGQRINLPTDHTEAEPLTAQGEDVVVGVRPDRFRMAAAGAVTSNTLTVLVDVVERPGGTLTVYGTLDAIGTAVVVQLPVETILARGQRLDLTFDAADVHLFALDGHAIGHRVPRRSGEESI